jgi:hypothetical protein
LILLRPTSSSMIHSSDTKRMFCNNVTGCNNNHFDNKDIYSGIKTAINSLPDHDRDFSGFGFTTGFFILFRRIILGQNYDRDETHRQLIARNDRSRERIDRSAVPHASVRAFTTAIARKMKRIKVFTDISTRNLSSVRQLFIISA